MTKRHKLLKQGKLPIVSFISQMPQTRHFVDTFTMDVALAMVSCVMNYSSCIVMLSNILINILISFILVNILILRNKSGFMS